MTAFHEPTALERAGSVPVPSADECAWPVEVSDHPADEATYREIMTCKGFGTRFTDHMAYAHWRAGEGWSGQVIRPYQPFVYDPAASVFHYGQEIFEGLKAYRHDDGSVWTFRPAYNGARLNHSARRLALPELPIEEFIASIVGLVRTDERWVPSAPGSSLYLRPFMLASEVFLGVRAAQAADYAVIASPSGPYFTNGFQPLNIWVSRDYHRAGPGGTGDAKCGGNYAASLVPKVEAHHEGFDEVCFLDAATDTYLEELGGMNVFVVYADGHVVTPALTGTILEGNTRSALLRLMRDSGVDAREERIALTDLCEGIRSGEIAEMFACGTAAVITPIGRLAGDDFDLTLPETAFSQKMYDRLTGIQLGHEPDPYGWLYRIC